VSAKRWKRILVVVSDPFAREQLAASKAAAVARRCGARLVFLNTFMVPQPVSDVPMGDRRQIMESAIRQRKQRLEDIARRFRVQPGTTCVVHWDFPIHEAVVRQVQKTKPDLVIAESHRHGRLARALLANTDWQLIRDCPTPIWFARSPDLSRAPGVLVAVDPRHTHAKPARLDDRLLQAALDLTRQLGGRIAIVHAYETPASGVPGMLMEPVRLPISPARTREFIARTTQQVTRLADKYRIPEPQRSVREGTPTEVIASEVDRRGTQILMMGAVSRSLLARPVIGNTAERVIDKVDCDVFVVKPAGFRSRVERVPVRA
jgi:universal stress protein E